MKKKKMMNESDIQEEIEKIKSRLESLQDTMDTVLTRLNNLDDYD
jgi:predicted  nucleic acid-binding Zn-ribbon protein